MSRVTCHVSCVMCHLSLVMLQLSLFFGLIGRASWWMVCYQWFTNSIVINGVPPQSLKQSLAKTVQGRNLQLSHNLPFDKIKSKVVSSGHSGFVQSNGDIPEHLAPFVPTHVTPPRALHKVAKMVGPEMPSFIFAD